MAKPKKISTDELIQIIENYISSHPYVGKLKYSDLVIFSKDIGYTNLIYQDFSRNSEIKQIINEFNEKNTLLNANKLSSTDDFKKITLNIDTIVETYSNDKKTQKALLNIFKDSYNKAFEKIQSLEISNKELIEKLSTSNKTLNDLHEENKKLKAELKSNKEAEKEKKKITQEKRIMSLIEYLIGKNCAQPLSKEDIIEVMKNIYYPSTSASDLLDSHTLDESVIEFSESLIKPDNTDEQSNVISLNPNFFD